MKIRLITPLLLAITLLTSCAPKLPSTEEMVQVINNQGAVLTEVIKQLQAKEILPTPTPTSKEK